jgi:hypothetical protein
MMGTKPQVHCISVMEVLCISVYAESLSAVVTVRKLISVAIVRILTTDDSALMFDYDYDMCKQSTLLYRLRIPLIKLLVSNFSFCRAMSAVSYRRGRRCPGSRWKFGDMSFHAVLRYRVFPVWCPPFDMRLSADVGQCRQHHNKLGHGRKCG